MIVVSRFVSAEPEVTWFSLNPHDEFAILASDGLWDVILNNEAVEIVKVRDMNSVSRALKL